MGVADRFRRAGFCFVLAALVPMHAREQALPARRVYSTSFVSAENPLSERGQWITGATVGLDWTNVATSRGLAHGEPMGVKYADPTAVLTGTWSADQAAQATVYTVNQNDALYQEVELRLRTTISAHSITGYEIFWKCSQTAKSYYSVVRWDGPLGKFTTLLGPVHGVANGVKNGDVIRATIVGNVITLYKNGVLVARVSDTAYRRGAPGIGFYLQPNTHGSIIDYGLTSFRAEELR